ncbi:MAG TPA: DUF2059 domain-containing protein [Verrucomicrobiae bacterium]|nr:DUF2059 domain-containing protein [Verrucomicrobiae bacterium]
MKAAIALILIYVGTFLVAIQGGSSTAVQAASQSTASKPSPSPAPTIDPAKDADIRALLELIGARDQFQESVNLIADQYREKLLASVPNNGKGQAFINNVISGYEKNFDVNQVTEQMVAAYDKHYTDDEIKGLLQFYGSPLGQKVAAEGPKISREVQEATRAAALKAVKDALQAAKEQDPVTGQNARLYNPPPRRWQQQRRPPQDAPEQAAQQSQP